MFGLWNGVCEGPGINRAQTTSGHRGRWDPSISWIQLQGLGRQVLLAIRCW